LVLIVLILSNRENRTFVEMVRAGGEQLEADAEAVAEDESVGALGAPAFEREVVSTRSNFTKVPETLDGDSHRSGDAA